MHMPCLVNGDAKTTSSPSFPQIWQRKTKFFFGILVLLMLLPPSDDKVILSRFCTPFWATRADANFRILENQASFCVVRFRVAEGKDEAVKVLDSPAVF